MAPSTNSIQLIQRNLVDLKSKRQISKEKIQNGKAILEKNSLDKDKADALAKRIKAEEDNLKRIDGVINNMLALEQSLEKSNNNSEVYQTMKTYSEALKKNNQMFGNREGAAKIVADVNEQVKKANEINDCFSNQIRMGLDSGDEDELLRELEEILQKEFNENLLESLPSVPNTDPNTATIRIQERIRSGGNAHKKTVSSSTPVMKRTESIRRSEIRRHNTVVPEPGPSARPTSPPVTRTNYTPMPQQREDEFSFGLLGGIAGIVGGIAALGFAIAKS